jgi:hypothetical protein
MLLMPVASQLHLGFHTGNPRVGFSHTEPEPAEPAPVAVWVQYRWVTGTVFRETRDASGTRGYYLLNLLKTHI